MHWVGRLTRWDGWLTTQNRFTVENAKGTQPPRADGRAGGRAGGRGDREQPLQQPVVLRPAEHGRVLGPGVQSHCRFRHRGTEY
jgi:hypothetical protein